MPRSEPYHVVIVREPEVEVTDDPKEAKERRRLQHNQRVEIISPAIRFAEPHRYNVQLKVTEPDETGTSQLRVVVLTDAVGIDRTEQLVIADPQFGRPVDPDAQERASVLLARVAAAAKPWNARPPKSIESYEYDLVIRDADKTHIRIDRDSPLGPAWSDISRLRGFAYMPPLRWLFSQPENVVFFDVQLADDRAVLVYRLKSARGFAAGLGVGPSWQGFFTKSFSAGTIMIDPRHATVLEHRFSLGPLGKETVETFDDYVAVGEGYAPRSLRIESERFDFHLSFEIHKDRLWLLDRAANGDRTAPSVRVENVVVNLTDGEGA